MYEYSPVVLVKLRVLKSRRGDVDEGLGTWEMLLAIVQGSEGDRAHTGHGQDTVGKLRVLEVGLEVREGVISEQGIHEGRAARVLEESGFHGVVEMQR